MKYCQSLLSVAFLAQVGSAQVGTCEERTIVRHDLVAPPSVAGASFSILPVFDANVTAAQRNVILQAVAEWEAIITSGGVVPNPYPILFKNGPLTAPSIGLHEKTTDSFGMPLSSTITFDDGTTWFVDPTPDDDAEFDPSVPAPTGTDFLSTARHELGHAMGWTGTPTYAVFAATGTFDPAVWNIALDPAGSVHAAPAVFPGDLMVPTMPPGVRRAITLYPDATLCARHYDRFLTMKFIDPSDTTPPYIGSAHEPRNSVVDAFDFSPDGAPLLITPRTYSGPSGGYTLSSPHVLRVSNGGNAVLK